MPYVIEGHIGDFRLEIRTWTAKQAFANAVEWRVVRRMSAVCINDGTKVYSIPEFAEAMAKREIADTV